MKTWDVSVELSNGNVIHVIGIGMDEKKAATHATKELDIDRIVSTEVLGEICISSGAKEIIDLMNELECQGANEVSFGALVDEDRTVKDVLDEIQNDICIYRNVKDWC